MEGQKIDISLLAEELRALAESSQDYADCALKASGRYKHIDSTILNHAIEIAFGRVKISSEVPELRQGFFTKKGLQQRTHPVIAKHHAGYFSGCKHVLEVCTGLGFDTLALSHEAEKVTSLEVDPHVAFCARENLRLLNVKNVEVINASLEDFLSTHTTDDFDGIWADPDRRAKGTRTRDAAEYAPSLELLLNLGADKKCAIKISPAIDVTIPEDWSREWIGFQGECKEQVILHGTSQSRESIYLADCGFSWKHETEKDVLIEPFPEGRQFYLIEPHPALTSSSLLGECYRTHEFSQWNMDIIYGFTCNLPPPSPLYQVFSIFFAGSYDEKKLRAQLSDLQWDSRTEIKKRVFPEEPESVRKRLKLPIYERDKTSHGVVFLTSNGKRKLMMLGSRV